MTDDRSKSLSPSRVESFLSCPLAFRFVNIDMLPEPPAPHSTKGSLVHRALELLFASPAAERTREAGAAALATAIEALQQQFVDCDPSDVSAQRAEVTRCAALLIGQESQGIAPVIALLSDVRRRDALMRMLVHDVNTAERRRAEDRIVAALPLLGPELRAATATLAGPSVLRRAPVRSLVLAQSWVPVSVTRLPRADVRQSALRAAQAFTLLSSELAARRGDGREIDAVRRTGFDVHRGRRGPGRGLDPHLGRDLHGHQHQLVSSSNQCVVRDLRLFVLEIDHDQQQLLREYQQQ